MITIAKFINGVGFDKGMKRVPTLTQELIDQDWFEMPIEVFYKPKRENGVIQEGATQQEINDIIENKAEQDAIALSIKETDDGIEAAFKLKAYLKRNLTVNQYNTAIPLVKPVWLSLKNGDWQNARNEMDQIQVNNEPYITMKAVILAKLDAYLNA